MRGSRGHEVDSKIEHGFLNEVNEKKNYARGGIRTHELLIDQILSLAPLAWLGYPRNYLITLYLHDIKLRGLTIEKSAGNAVKSPHTCAGAEKTHQENHKYTNTLQTDNVRKELL